MSAKPEITAAEDASAEPAQQASSSGHLSKKLVAIMACACATAVANIYYNQPLLSQLAQYFHAPISHAGLIATAAQVGYATGLLFFVPLGDIVERRTIILTLFFACAGFLILTALSASLPMLIAMQLLVGTTAVGAQLLIPLAVDLAEPSERGSIIGSLMAGLLCGLLVARTISGVIADRMGWRATFWLASGLMLLTGAVLHVVLPHRAPTQRLTYGRLLRSLWELTLGQPILRSISVISALSFASFCSFWAVLSFFLHDRHNMGSTAAGLFGLVGLAGAMCAPFAGKLSDRRGPGLTLTIALILSALSFGIMWLDGSILGLIIAVLLLDLGVQSTQVAAQAEVITLLPESRNRLNTVYMVSRFVGGAIGSWAGSIAYAHHGWASACLFSIAALLLALAVQLRTSYRPIN